MAERAGTATSKGDDNDDVLARHTGGTARATEEELQQPAQAWRDWLGKLGPALADPGNPTTPTAKRISSDGSIHDGPRAQP
jgi:hypothetical protein